MNLKCEEFWNSFPCQSTKVSCHVDMFESLKTTNTHTHAIAITATTSTATATITIVNVIIVNEMKRDAYTRTRHVANTFISNKMIVIAHGTQTKNVQLKCSLTIFICCFAAAAAADDVVVMYSFSRRLI